MWEKLIANAAKWKTLGRVCVFIVVFCLCFSFVSTIFQPAWFTENNFYSLNGFYEQPRNTIETLFLGSSVMRNALNPIQLYNDYGICAYNISTSRQPFLVSYAWLMETYRYHPETLKTVFVDASLLRQSSPEAMYHRGLDRMRLSWDKAKLMWEYTEGDFEKTMSFLFPLVSYHTRWDELEVNDFAKLTEDPLNGTRGYLMVRGKLGDIKKFHIEPAIPLVRRENRGMADLYDESEKYFAKMAEFCKKHGIKLVLMRTASQNWSARLSLASENLAKAHDVQYLDFCYLPLAAEINYLPPLDNEDSSHLNYLGSKKLTEWIGKYLISECGGTDVRGTEKYSFMEEESRRYNLKTGLIEKMCKATTVAECIQSVKHNGITAFILVQGEACVAMTDDLRAAIRETGLHQLADLASGEEYIAVVKDGEVIYEMTDTPVQDEPLTYTGVFNNGTQYVLISDQTEKKASCLVDNIEYVPKGHGISISAFNSQTGEVAFNKTVFDTAHEASREVYTAEMVADILALGDQAVFAKNSLEDRIQKYIWKQNVANESVLRGEVFESGQLLEFLETYRMDSDKMILLSVRDEGANSLTDDVRAYLQEFGLYRLARIQFRNSYLGVIDGGTVVVEKSSNTSAVSWKDDVFSVKSAGHDMGNFSSIIINGEEYSGNSRGLNAVVFDKKSKQVVACGTLDSFEREVIVPEDMAQRYPNAIALFKNAVEQKELYGNGDLFGYLDTFLADYDNAVLIVARDEASTKLDDADRNAFAQYGLDELAELGFREPYVACIDANGVIFEQKGEPDQVVTHEHGIFELCSAGYNAGNNASIRINDREYSLNTRGLNLVVYDRAEGKVIGQITFDSYAKEIINKEVAQ